jgi:hypothetical protein
MRSRSRLAALHRAACLLALAHALFAGCAPEGTVATVEPAFRGDADPGGPSLRIEAVPTESAARVRILGRDLGPVFGLAARLRFDSDAVAVDVPEGAEASLSAVLSPDPAVVRSLVSIDEGGASFGTTHVWPGSESDLGGDRVLVELDVHALEPGASRLALERVSVRRADGSIVEVDALGGELVLAEVAR